MRASCFISALSASISAGMDPWKRMRGPSGEVDLGEVAAVSVENIDRAKLVELAAGESVRDGLRGPTAKGKYLPGGRGCRCRSGHAAARPCSTTARPDSSPWPALRRRRAAPWAGGAEKVEESLVGAGDGSEELPAGKDRGLAVRVADMRLQFGRLFAAFERRACGAGAGETGVDGGQDAFR